MSSSRVKLRRILRRYRVPIAVILIFLVIIRVPLMPYSPYCRGRTAVGPVFLAPAFRTEFTERLRQWNVSYIALGGLVLVRVWDWISDPDDLLINADGKALYSLVDEKRGADAARLPARVRELIAYSTGSDGWVERNCELVRAVANEGW
jgi:hypothetical protein